MRQSIPSDRQVADFPALGEDVVDVVHQIGENEAVSGGDFLGSIEETSEAARAAHQECSACYRSQLQEFAPVHACPPSSDPGFSFLASRTVSIVTPKDLEMRWRGRAIQFSYEAAEVAERMFVASVSFTRV